MPERKADSRARRAYEWVQALVCVRADRGADLYIRSADRAGVGGVHAGDAAGPGLLVVLNNWLCGGYEQGDIVILQGDDFYGGEPIVKRVIATEGQTVDIDFDAGVVYVDGTALEEPYIREPTWIGGGDGISPDGAGGLRLRHGRQPQRQ